MERTLAGVPVLPTREEVGFAGLGLEGESGRFVTSGLPCKARLFGRGALVKRSQARLSGQYAGELPSEARLFRRDHGGLPSAARLSGLIQLALPSSARVCGFDARSNPSACRLRGLVQIGRSSTTRISGLSLSLLPFNVRFRITPGAFGEGKLGAQPFGHPGAVTLAQLALPSRARIYTLRKGQWASATRIAGFLSLAWPCFARLAGFAPHGLPARARLTGFEATKNLCGARICGLEALGLRSQALLVRVERHGLPSSARLTGTVKLGTPTGARLSGYHQLALPCAVQFERIVLQSWSSEARLSGKRELQLASHVYVRPYVLGFGATYFGAPAELRIHLPIRARLFGRFNWARPTRARLEGSTALALPSHIRLAKHELLGLESTARIASTIDFELPARARLCGVSVLGASSACFITAAFLNGSRTRITGTASLARPSKALVMETGALYGLASTARLRGSPKISLPAAACLFRTRAVHLPAGARLQGQSGLILEAKAKLSSSIALPVRVCLAGALGLELPSKARLLFVPYGQLGRVRFGDTGLGWAFIGHAYQLPMMVRTRGMRAADWKTQANLTIRRELYLPACARFTAVKLNLRASFCRIRGVFGLALPSQARLSAGFRKSVTSRTYLVGDMPRAEVLQEPLVVLSHRIIL